LATEERQVRVARNQMLFRSVNERIEQLSEGFLDNTQDLDFNCECPDSSCTETIRMTGEEFAAIRGIENRLIVLPGHVVPDVEDVVARRGGYALVAKRAVAGEVVHENS
jgi:hypothetical protein